MKRPNSRTSTAGERDRPKRPDTVTCTEVLNLPRENYCSLSAGNRTLGGSPRRGRPTVHLSSNEGGGLIPGVRDPVYSPQSCEGVLFCTGAGQDTPREPQTLFVHLSSHEEGLNPVALALFKGRPQCESGGQGCAGECRGKVFRPCCSPRFV